LPRPFGGRENGHAARRRWRPRSAEPEGPRRLGGEKNRPRPPTCSCRQYSGRLHQPQQPRHLRTVSAFAPVIPPARRYDGEALNRRSPYYDRDTICSGGRRSARADRPAVRSVLFCTPECTPAPCRSFEEPADWTVAPVDYGKPAAWITASRKAAASGRPTLAPCSIQFSTPTSSNRRASAYLYAAPVDPDGLNQ